MDKKHERERFYLDHFIKILNLNVDSIDRGNDPPDFILKLNESLQIELEETEFHSDAIGSGGHPRRLIEEEWIKLRSKIKEQRKNHPDLQDVACVISFKELRVPTSQEQEKFIIELFDFVRTQIRNLTKNLKDFPDFPADSHLLNKYLRKLVLNKGGYSICWDWNQTSTSVGLFEHELLEVIKSKITFKKNPDFNESWLLIVSETGLPQSMGVVDAQKLNGFVSVNDVLKAGSFDRVYIYQYHISRILEWKKDSGWKMVYSGEI